MAARGQNHGKGKNKQAYAPKPKIPPPPKREDPIKDLICHECGESGHWKRNYPQYIAELLKKKKNAASRAGGSGLRACRKLKPGALSLYVGTGQLEAVEIIGVFYLDGFINRFVNNTIQVSRNNMVYFSAIPRYVIVAAIQFPATAPNGVALAQFSPRQRRQKLMRQF
nr:zinc finger, CCHC-type [Tanacetum cinerariifolium]